MKRIPWEEYDNGELVRCGKAPFRQLMEWMGSFGRDAKAFVRKSDKPHSLYGCMHIGENGSIIKVSYYCDSYSLTDEELDALLKGSPTGTTIFYVAHK